MRITSPTLTGLLLSVLLLACGDDPPALSVDGVHFPEEDLLGLTDDREDRLVALTALGLAFARGEIEEAGAPLLERRREDLLLDRFAADLVLEGAGIEDDVLRAQYLTNPRYELVVRHVVALAEEGAADGVHRTARATAEEALERVDAGEPVSEVAAALSEEPGAAERGGRLQPGRRGSWVAGFWEAANGLEEGEHTGVVRTEYGYHVIQLEERRTVPFEEVRSDVALQAGTMLGGVEEAWNRWADSISGSIRLDTAAIRRSSDAGALELAGLALAGIGMEDGSATGTGSGTGDGNRSSTILATWEAGSDTSGAGEPVGASGGPARSGGPVGSDGVGGYTLGSFQHHLASLPEDRRREVADASGPGELAAEIRREAVRHRALEEASWRGLSLSEGPREQTAREWTDRANAWAVSLGFEAGSSPSAVRSQALAALSTTRQNAAIARRELGSREPLLRAAYAVGEASDP